MLALVIITDKVSQMKPSVAVGEERVRIVVGNGAIRRAGPNKKTLPWPYSAIFDDTQAATI